ncbi:MAG TPA: TIGR00282 family metallophosphoesterase [Candidatus Cloacimonadota bacterium]|nr:TIGR00282 family metallophosphoesterase [Candidatus Cloacimonadota bacterium]
MKILFIGDIFGKPGRAIIKDCLTDLKREFATDAVIANGENVAQGRGITEKTATELFHAGIDAFTSGNHLWDQKNALEYIKTEQRIVKPLNYPAQSPGFSSFILDVANGKLALLCLVGQAFMSPAGFPHEAIDKILPEIQSQTPNILVDFHAEATAEKRALGFYLDGKVSALLGTHTHIQTADEEILPGGTAYITDVGMTGPHDSVIGTEKKIILEKLLNGIPQRYDVAQNGWQLNAVFLELDEQTGKAISIQRIRRKIS